MEIVWPKSFHFVGRSHPEGREVPADEILARAASVAEFLATHGVGSGDRIALWLNDGVEQLAAVFGCWSLGATFCVLPSFAGRTATDRSRARVENILTILNPKLLLQGKGFQLPDVIASQAKTIELDLDALPECISRDPLAEIAARPDDDMAFIQFTSGSTGGNARGAVVRFGQLQANLDALAKRVQLTEQDRMVSWAPMYHDMGLMAVLLPLRVGADLVLMETDHFVRRPTAWLIAISNYKGTVSTAPPTALRLLTRRKPADVDLSSWRYAWIGGEQVFPSVLDGFEKHYAHAGLARGVMQPTYGMAETVVGTSCGVPGEPWDVQDGFISCGPLLEDMELQIIDDEGVPVAPGSVGNLQVRGPSVMSGYLGMEPFAPGSWYDAGDLGFARNERIYITGRVKDLLKRGAETFPAALVEAVAEDALGLRTGRAAAFANLRDDIGKEEIVLLVESPDWSEERARDAAAAISQELGLQVDVIRNTRGARLPRTSSGKLMRQMAAMHYREGEL